MSGDFFFPGHGLRRKHKDVLMKFARRATSGLTVGTYVKPMKRNLIISTQETERGKGQLCSLYLELKTRKAGEAGDEDLWAPAAKRAKITPVSEKQCWKGNGAVTDVSPGLRAAVRGIALCCTQYIQREGFAILVRRAPSSCVYLLFPCYSPLLQKGSSSSLQAC